MDAVLTSSSNKEWETPPALFSALHEIFDFTVDCAATGANACVTRYISKDVDFTSMDPMEFGALFGQRQRCFINPPYGDPTPEYPKTAGHFLETALALSLWGHSFAILIPARTDTKAWQHYVPRCTDVFLFKGRLRYCLNGVPVNPAPFPSALLMLNCCLPPYDPPGFPGMRIAVKARI